MSTEIFYALVTFVRDPNNELSALNTVSMPTMYRALREASYSIGKTTNAGCIVGAIVFSQEVDAVGELKGDAIVSSYGDTPTNE
ncbi:hypothetical protein GCM10007874_60280 [Labrys miyagiensis]|uniref:Uncharacterized protein n=1 Tax=Labrys miyagiensis TaxID=346912 RepID=A0ABQ6CRP6_9HYPH|nr:hypothetical protein [Labrys miyagiensis]GLS23008.1 hypothetical protein GCM10007874_60280 [Labrys miyagiensis]